MMVAAWRVKLVSKYCLCTTKALMAILIQIASREINTIYENARKQEGTGRQLLSAVCYEMNMLTMLTHTASREHADEYSIQHAMNKLTHTIWNEHAGEYSMKCTCWRMQYEINMLTNTICNEHADEHEINTCSMKWTCLKKWYEINMLTSTIWNEHADEYNIEINMLTNTICNEHADE